MAGVEAGTKEAAVALCSSSVIIAESSRFGDCGTDVGRLDETAGFEDAVATTSLRASVACKASWISLGEVIA